MDFNYLRMNKMHFLVTYKIGDNLPATNTPRYDCGRNIGKNITIFTQKGEHQKFLSIAG